MFHDRLDADRFFARIRSVDVECPKCGEIYIVNPHTPLTRYNPRTGRLHCGHCGLTIALGVIAYPVTAGGPGPLPTPPDWTPTPREALALREALAGRYATPADRATFKSPRNIAMRPECRCILDPDKRTLRIAPGCPLHGLTKGSTAAADPLRPAPTPHRRPPPAASSPLAHGTGGPTPPAGDDEDPVE